MFKVIVSVVAVDVNPVPPAIVNVSVPTVIVSVPESPAIDISDDIAVVLAAVNRPCASTVNVGIAVEEPYEPAVTAVLSNAIVIVFDVPVDVSPVPPAIVSVSPKDTLSLPESPAIVILELSKALFGMLVNDAPEPENAVAVTVPLTSSAVEGVVVLIPALPP